jgi:hypothetical protein
MTSQTATNGLSQPTATNKTDPAFPSSVLKLASSESPPTADCYRLSSSDEWSNYNDPLDITDKAWLSLENIIITF